MSSRSTQIDRINLVTLLERERKAYRDNHAKSLELYKDAKNLFGGVPMPWMNKWVGGFPLYMQGAKGNIITDVDGPGGRAACGKFSQESELGETDG